MKFIGIALAIFGFLLIASAPGAQDFYEQCKAAADCVAGDPPGAISIIAKVVGGMVIAWLGIALALQD